MTTNTRSPWQVVKSPAPKIVGHWLLNNFWPIFGATWFCSIRCKMLSFKQHCAIFTDTHRYAFSHSSVHAWCVAVACFRLSELCKFFVLFTQHSFATAHYFVWIQLPPNHCISV